MGAIFYGTPFPQKLYHSIHFVKKKQTSFHLQKNNSVLLIFLKAALPLNVSHHSNAASDLVTI